MKKIIKVVESTVIFIIGILLVALINSITSSYSMGLLEFVIVASCIAGIVTIWTFEPENINNSGKI